MKKGLFICGLVFLIFALAISGCRRKMPPREIAQNLKTTFILKEHQAPVYCLAYHPQGKMFASGDAKGRIILWSPEKGEKLKEFTFQEVPLFTLDFSPDGRYLAVGGKSQSVMLYDMEKLEVYTSFPAHSSWVMNLCWIDERILATASCSSLAPHRLCSAGEIAFWKIGEKPELVKRISVHKDWVVSLSASSDHRWLASGGADRVINLYDLKAQTLLKSLRGHEHKISALSFLGKDSRHLVSAGFDGVVLVWKVPEGKLVRRLGKGLGEIYALTTDREGKLIAGGGREQKLWLWEADSGKKIREITGFNNYISSLVFSPDAKVLVVGFYEPTVVVLKAEERKE